MAFFGNLDLYRFVCDLRFFLQPAMKPTEEAVRMAIDDGMDKVQAAILLDALPNLISYVSLIR